MSWHGLRRRPDDLDRVEEDRVDLITIQCGERNVGRRHWIVEMTGVASADDRNVDRRVGDGPGDGELRQRDFVRGCVLLQPFHEFEITSRGMVVKEALTQYQGLLTAEPKLRAAGVRPSYPGLTEEMLAFVISTFREFCARAPERGYSQRDHQ